MSQLLTIPGIGKTSVELLEAAGFLDENSLAKAGVDELVSELERANRILKIAKRAPYRAEVEKWLSAARERAGVPLRPESVGSDVEASSSPLVPVNYEGNPEVAALLAKAPSALPLPPQLLIESRLAVSDIDPAIVLNRVVGDLDVRVTETASGRPIRVGGGVSSVQLADAAPSKRDIDASRIRSIANPVSSADPGAGEMSAAVVRPVQPVQPGQMANDRVALIRAPREGTNKGRNPESRFYVRGVLHTHPYQLMFGAIVTLVMMLVLPVAVGSAGLLLLSDLKPEHFGWVPKWLLAFPLALPLGGIAYLIWGIGAGKCRICGQKLFFPKACRKNAKAHHIPFIGYILPTALHMLVFRWFRCTYCGTPVRVKE